MIKPQAKIPSSLYKVTAFTAITVLVIGLLATLIGNITFEPARHYYALFSDATGVYPGDRVRVSGVEVGAVRGVELVGSDGHKVARLDFTVDSTVPIYPSAQLQLRYENIVGQRYLNISERPQAGADLPAGSTFGVTQTTPALSLTELFNGFQPLFRALDPARLNAFSYELLRALQGESGTVASLMQNTAQLTNSLADRDQVIGGVVSNLNTVLTTVGDRDQKLTGLIVEFRQLMSGLAGQSSVIGASLPSLDQLISATAGTLRDIRPPLRSSLSSLNAVAGSLYADRAVLDKSLKGLPFALRTLARTGSYGSWFNFYVCGLNLNLTLLKGTVKFDGVGGSANEKDTVCAGGVG